MKIETPHWKQNDFLGITDSFFNGYVPYPRSRRKYDVAARTEYTEEQWFDAQVKKMAERTSSLCFPGSLGNSEEIYGVKHVIYTPNVENKSRARTDLKEKYGDACQGYWRYSDMDVEIALPPTVDRVMAKDREKAKDFLYWHCNVNSIHARLIDVINNSLLDGKRFPGDDILEEMVECRSENCEAILSALLDLDEKKAAFEIAQNNAFASQKGKTRSWAIPDSIKMRVANTLIQMPARITGVPGSYTRMKLMEHPLYKMARFLENTKVDNEILLRVNEGILERTTSGRLVNDVLETSTEMIFDRIKDGNVEFEQDVMKSLWSKPDETSQNGESIRDARRNMFIKKYPDRLSLSCNSMKLVRNELGGKTGLENRLKRFRDKINRKYRRKCT